MLCNFHFFSEVLEYYLHFDPSLLLYSYFYLFLMSSMRSALLFPML